MCPVKKCLAVTLSCSAALLLMFGLVGCNQQPAAKKPATPPPAEKPEPEKDKAPAPTPPEKK
jgi:hypothetical protein